MLPIQNDPPETDGNRNRGQHHPEGKKENEFAAPAYAHAEILTRYEGWQKNLGLNTPASGSLQLLEAASYYCHQPHVWLALCDMFANCFWCCL